MDVIVERFGFAIRFLLLEGPEAFSCVSLKSALRNARFPKSN